MSRELTLSLATIDILWEELGLGRAVFPFELPRNGRTLAERAGIREAVYADLHERGLASGGRCADSVRQPLTLLAVPNIAVTLVGLLGHNCELRARSASDGRSAVLAVLHGQKMTIDQIHPTSVASAIVALLPNEPAGRGQSVTISQDDSTSRNQLSLAARSYLRRPRRHVGQFGVTVTNRAQTERRTQPLGWFDTDHGRYLCQITSERDGRNWTTYAPATLKNITQYLDRQVQVLTDVLPDQR